MPLVPDDGDGRALARGRCIEAFDRVQRGRVECVTPDHSPGVAAEVGRHVCVVHQRVDHAAVAGGAHTGNHRVEQQLTQATALQRGDHARRLDHDGIHGRAPRGAQGVRIREDEACHPPVTLDDGRQLRRGPRSRFGTDPAELVLGDRRVQEIARERVARDLPQRVQLGIEARLVERPQPKALGSEPGGRRRIGRNRRNVIAARRVIAGERTEDPHARNAAASRPDCPVRAGIEVPSSAR